VTAFDDDLSQLTATQRALLDAWLAAEDGAAQSRSTPYVAPSTDAERLLARLWQDVLELPRVGVDDDYVAAGGDSIHAIVIVAKAEAAGLRVGTQDLLEARTIRRLAELAEPVPAPAPHAAPPTEPAAAGAPPAGPAAATGRAQDGGAPLSPLQEGMLFHALASPRATYLVQVVCELVGDLDVPAMRAAWTAVVERHPALRATFHWSGGGPPVQRHAPHAPVPFEHHDWRSVPAKERDEQLRGYLAADAERGVDLTCAPLLRLALLRTADQVHRCVWTHHHLLLDGWSQHLVLADVLDAYAELVAGRQPTVPRRPSGADYPATAPDQAVPDQDGFWRRYLAGYSGPAPLPPAPVAGAATAATGSAATSSAATSSAATGSAGGAGDNAAGDNAVSTRLPAASFATLNGFCRANGLTVGTVVLGGWAVLLARLTGADDVVVGMTVSGRSAATPGLTDAVGMFINTLPVRVRAGGPGERLLPWLRELHANQVAVGRYERTPLPSIARCSEVPPGRPLFDSIVVLENFPSRLAEVQPRAGLRIRDADAFVDEGYPLVLEATPSADLLLRVRYDRGRFTGARVAVLAEALRGFLAGLPAGVDRPLAELAAGMGAELDRHAAAARSALHEDAAGRLRRSRRQPVRVEDA